MGLKSGSSKAFWRDRLLHPFAKLSPAAPAMAMRSLVYASTCGLSAILLGCGSDPCKPRVQKGLDKAAQTDCSTMEDVPMADCKCTNEVTKLGVFTENAETCEKNEDCY